MSLFNTAALWSRILPGKRRKPKRVAAERMHICRFEEMEPRQMLTVAPAQIHLGSVFFDPSPHTDTSANTIQVTFQGGASGTQLTQLVIDGQKSPTGPAAGDITWNTVNAPLTIVSNSGFQITSEQVSNGGSQITLDFSGFVSGDKLVLTVGADEIVSLGLPTPTVAPLASGNDFQDSHSIGTFTTPHFEPITVNTSYVAGFDHLFSQNNTTSGTTLDLPTQNYEPPSNTDQSLQTAGASVLVTQTPLPIFLSGTVYDDANQNNVQDAGETGVAGVTLTLLESNGSQFISTGETATTDANGNYAFQFLQPGTYEVDETVPSGYFAVGASAGTVANTTDGSVVGKTVITQIALLGGDTSVQNDFGLIRPASVTGNVSDCLADKALSGVTVNLLNSSGQVIQTTTTDAQGNYQFTGLAPDATYGVAEIVPSGYMFHQEAAGSVGGAMTVAAQITSISLGDGTAATAYNFCDVLPASISGSVDDCLANNPLSGVTVNLLNGSGQVLQSTTTDAEGNYQFTGLLPGVSYGVQEIVPTGYMFHLEAAGSVGGSTSVNTQITQIALTDGLAATQYNFCDVLPASISGNVSDCLASTPLSGVTVNLLNASGQVVQTTTTNAQGNYQFTGLLPDSTYGVQEIVPAGYMFHLETAGSVGGVTTVSANITSIALGDGTAATAYNFCDVLPSTISGSVDDCLAGTPLSGVTVNLLDSTGKVLQTTTTDESGDYSFAGLLPGATYGVQELLPTGYLFHEESAGSVGGVTTTNMQITGIMPGDGATATDYDFCDVLPASIAGKVIVDTTGQFQSSEPGLPGVTVELLNSGGTVISTTVTDANGNYAFLNLMPGTYDVESVTPAGYFAAEASPGSLGGTAVGMIEITEAPLSSGSAGTDYDFYVQPPGTISGYVFQDGTPIQIQPGQTLTPQIAQMSDSTFGPGDIPLAGITLDLADQNGNPILDSNGNAITTTTDINGFYQFTGLPAGSYTVVEDASSVNALTGQGDYLGITMPGTTGGVAFNFGANQNPSAQELGGAAIPNGSDAIVKIPVPIGVSSQSNNFSVVTTELVPIPPPPPPPPNPPVPPPPPFTPPVLNPPTTAFVPAVSPTPMSLPPMPPIIISQLTVGGGGEVAPYAWHLSIVDAGQPRETDAPDNITPDAGPLVYNADSWQGLDLGHSRWTVNTGDGNPDLKYVFGTPGAVPVSGDFLGDGRTLLGVFINGEWFIDVNGDGVWDAGDLYCKLGGPGDTPIVGDWDGDGKDDIGVFGPGWFHDDKAIAREAGLPKPTNPPTGAMKNMPPKPADANMQGRTLRLTMKGKLRPDVIDHVFQYGQPGDIPVVGDWTGSGVRTLGIFRDGVWYLDVNGTGKWAPNDIQAKFGLPGDIPIVGDWNNSGVDSIGVYRNGEWHLDVAHTFEWSTADVRNFGQAGDRPVAGDFNGSGHTQIGVYHEGLFQKAPGESVAAVPTAKK